MTKCAVLVILFLGCAGPQQTTGINDIYAPEGADVIFIHTTLSDQMAYRQVAQELQERGYAMRTTDEVLKSISTEFKGVTQSWGVDDNFVRISASIRGESNSKIAIRGWYKTLSNEDTDTGQTIRKFGQNESPARNAWNEMYQIAISLGDSLSY